MTDSAAAIVMFSDKPFRCQNYINMKARKRGYAPLNDTPDVEMISGPAGKDGTNGTNGTNGADGKSVMLSMIDGKIKWSHDGLTWVDLVPLSMITGPSGKDGTNGIDGKDGNDGRNGIDGKDGKNGTNGKDGSNATPDMVASSVSNYLINNPVKNGVDGKDGINGKDGTNGLNGAKGTDGTNGTNGKDGIDGKSVELQISNGYIQWRSIGTTAWNNLVLLSTLKGDPGTNGTNGTNGAKGDTGPSGSTLVGQVVIGQTATVAITLGIREVTASLTGAVAGERYLCFVRSYKLNGGASVAGRPSGYAILDCVSNAAGQITVSLNAPALALNASYVLTCDIMKIT